MKRELSYWASLHRQHVTPNEEEKKKVKHIAEEIISKCRSAAEKHGKKVEVLLGGSYAHETWLPGRGDIDVFLAFDKTMGKNLLSTDGLNIANESLLGYKVVTRYAEHPYLEAYVEGVRVNVVPCLKVEKGEWISAADRSPYHTEYMSERLNDEMRLQVRLLKKLMQAQRIYGAEIKIKGFSGYVCEVLIAKYGNLQELLKAASRWLPDSVISLEEVKGKVDGFAILDPVDTRRNLARAIAPWKLAEFIFLSRMIIDGTKCDPFVSPLLEYLDDNEIEGMLEEVLVISFSHKSETEDTIWGELGRSSSALVKHLEREGFKILNYSYSSDLESSAIAFLLPGEARVRINSRLGPEIYRASETLNFLLSKKTISWFLTDDFRTRRIEAGRLVDVKDAIKYFMEKPVERVGFSKGIAGYARASLQIMNGREALKAENDVIRDAVRRVFGYSPEMDSC